MSAIKTHKMIKYILDKNGDKIRNVSEATLNILEGKLELDMNGTPSNIVMNYRGAGSFTSNMPVSIKTKIGKSVILISNLFKEEFPQTLFSYYGDVEIYSCSIVNYDNSKLDVVVNNTQLEKIIDKSKSNFEDETEILISETKKVKRRNLKSGLARRTVTRKADRTESKYNPLKEAKPTDKPSIEPQKPTGSPIGSPIKPQNRTNIKYEGGKK